MEDLTQAQGVPVPDDVDMHHRAFFSFEPALFLADLGNIALDYCISGIHQLERAIHESPLFQQQADSSLAPHCPELQQQINEQLHQFKAAASEVLAEVQRRMAHSVNRAADNFERYEAATNLHVPPELYVEQPMPVPEPVDEQQEAQLDAELQQLRDQVQQACAECRQLKQQLQHMDADISNAAARSDAFKPLAEAVSASSGPLLEEAAAIGTLSAKLRPMVARAQQLQQQQAHNPIASALAAASGGRARRAQAGGGSRAAAATAGGGGGGLADGGLEQHVRQLMAETGASLTVLQQTNAALAQGAAGQDGAE